MTPVNLWYPLPRLPPAPRTVILARQPLLRALLHTPPQLPLLELVLLNTRHLPSSEALPPKPFRWSDLMAAINAGAHCPGCWNRDSRRPCAKGCIAYAMLMTSAGQTNSSLASSSQLFECGRDTLRPYRIIGFCGSCCRTEPGAELAASLVPDSSSSSSSKSSAASSLCIAWTPASMNPNRRRAGGRHIPLWLGSHSPRSLPLPPLSSG